MQVCMQMICKKSLSLCQVENTNSSRLILVYFFGTMAYVLITSIAKNVEVADLFVLCTTECVHLKGINKTLA